MAGRRTGDAHMHLGGAGVPEHFDDLGRGGAAHNRTIDQDDALALDLVLVDVVLELSQRRA